MSLYFVPVDKFSTANPFIVMKWSKFSIPEAAMFPDLVYFNVKSFTAFTRDIAGLGMTFNPVNDFLETISLEEQKAIASAFLVMHIEISDPQYTVDKIEQLEDDKQALHCIYWFVIICMGIFIWNSIKND